MTRLCFFPLPLLALIVVATGCTAVQKPVTRATPEPVLPSAGPMPSEAPDPGPPMPPPRAVAINTGDAPKPQRL